MAIDIGTTSVKCLVMDQEGEIVTTASHGYPIINPQTSWVEQNPIDWWQAVIQSIRDCLKVVNAEQIVGISLSGHMSALIMVDGEGTPLYPSILIADTRSAAQTAYLRNHFLKRFIEVTGNEPIDAFTVSKLLWMKEEEQEVFERTSTFLFPKDFIRYQLSGKFGTDPTDAGNSLLYDQEHGDWNWGLIHELRLPKHIFPEVKETASVFGAITEKAAKLTGLKRGTPIVTGGADMACSQIGTGAIFEGTLAITLSTSGQVVASIPSSNENGIGKVTFHPGAGKNTMYTMGTIFTGGLGVEWGYKFLFNKREMKTADYQELDKLTDGMEQYGPGSRGLLFLPFLVGSGTPYFDANDRASWIGLTLNQDKSLLLRSILEGITFNILENVNVLKDMGVPIEKVYLGAGGSRNSVWCQIIADILGLNVNVLEKRDGSAIGAAILAGTGIGMFHSIDDAVKKIVKSREEFSYSQENYEQYKKLFKGYQKVYKALNQYAKMSRSIT
jgi:xylulokinase